MGELTAVSWEELKGGTPKPITTTAAPNVSTRAVEEVPCWQETGPQLVGLVTHPPNREQECLGAGVAVMVPQESPSVGQLAGRAMPCSASSSLS